MKFIIIILLLGSSIALCQNRYQPPKVVDTIGQKKLIHHIYTYDGIVRKPWTFYKVVNGELQALPDSEQVSNKTEHWDKFILTVRDITVNCAGNSANVTVIYNKVKSHYLLKQSAPNKYIFKNGVVNLILITKSSLICDFYFIKETEAASVSNMDWEMGNDSKQ
jgi:hypothetical protein